MNDLAIIIITTIILVAGILSAFFMVFPSLAFMFIVTFIYALINHFQHISALELGILAAIAILAEVIDYLSGFIGAKIGGAKFKSLLFGLIGLIIGLIIYPPFGGIFGLFLGILLAELIFNKNLFHALKAGFGSVLGTLVGTVIKIILAIIYLICFLVFVF